MTLKIADRLFETTATTGTGTLTLAGTVQGFQSFSVIGTGIKTPYYIDDADVSGIAQNWEAGIGTVTIAGSVVTLSRDTVLASSNSNIAVNFGVGTKNVRGGIPAAMLPVLDENLNSVRSRALNTTGSTTNAHAIALPYTPIAYSDGMPISYRIPATNTTAGVTVNVNGKGAVPLKYLGADPGVGMLTSGLMLNAVYNSVTTAFDIVNITKVPEISGGEIGLILANNATDAVNDIDVTAGNRWSDDALTFIKLASAMTKRLDAAWAAGNGNGGLDTGSKAVSTTYHVFLISLADGSAADVLFSASLTPTLPGSYTKKRRIGSIFTNGSGSIVAFTQIANQFLLKTVITDSSAAVGTTASLIALSVPSGIKVDAMISGVIYKAAVFTCVLFTSPDQLDTMPVLSVLCDVQQAGTDQFGMYQKTVRTNTSRQIRARADVVNVTVRVNTTGWIDLEL